MTKNKYFIRSYNFFCVKRANLNDFCHQEYLCFLSVLRSRIHHVVVEYCSVHDGMLHRFSSADKEPVDPAFCPFLVPVRFQEVFKLHLMAIKVGPEGWLGMKKSSLYDPHDFVIAWLRHAWGTE